MASDNYIQIDGLKGECLASGYKDWIEIIGFEHSIAQPTSATASSTGGATKGRVQHGDFIITKYIDLSSPMLYQLCSSGKHIKSVEIDLNRSSGDKSVKYMSIKLTQVVIARVAPSTGAGADFPTETVAFNYGAIEWTYTQQKRTDGSQGGNTQGKWSLIENKAA